MRSPSSFTICICNIRDETYHFSRESMKHIPPKEKPDVLPFSSQGGVWWIIHLDIDLAPSCNSVLVKFGGKVGIFVALRQGSRLVGSAWPRLGSWYGYIRVMMLMLHSMLDLCWISYSIWYLWNRTCDLWNAPISNLAEIHSGSPQTRVRPSISFPFVPSMMKSLFICLLYCLCVGKYRLSQKLDI